MSFDAEGYLDSLEALGMRFGLERMHRLVSALGMPQHRFASLHVVGTNGKSSVTEMTAALIEAHGHRAGAYLSPHSRDWRERVSVAGAAIGPEEFASATERVAQAAVAVERTLEPGERITQFEAATASAFVALAAAGVEFAVIEAGLGGRLDATNVLPSKVTVLTSVGLEHTEFLGDTLERIAAEKLAVLARHSVLVIGRLPASIAAIARRTASERQARLVVAESDREPPPIAARAPYLRRNFAVARAAAEAAIGPLEPDALSEVAAALELHGRMELIGGDPPLYLDAAHNPDGAAALAEALGALAGAPPAFVALAALADKDAAGIVGALAPVAGALVATEIPPRRLARAGRPGASALAAAELAAAARAAGIARVETLADPLAAVARVRELAAAEGGVAVVCGSHYLLGYAL